MPPSRAPEPADETRLLERVLDELGHLRRAVEGLATRMGAVETALAAHPESTDLRNALERIRVLEAREETAKQQLAEAKADIKAQAGRIEALERGEAKSGVTITGVHKAAGAAVLLITAALMWLGGRVTAPAAAPPQVVPVVATPPVPALPARNP